MANAYDGPWNWLAEDMEDSSQWLIQLGKEHVGELDMAIKKMEAEQLTIAEVNTDTVPLPFFSQLVPDILDRLENGRGVIVIRGFPAHLYEKSALRLLYWAIGKTLGTAVSQSSKGDLLGDVRNFGSDVNGPSGRGYMSKQDLPFHTDTADTVALMVLRKAKSGGRSMICSSVAIRNEIAAKRPDLLKVLHQPFFWSWKGQEARGELPYYQQPIYSEHNGKFSSRYIQPHITAAYENFKELPPLAYEQLEAMTYINRLANDPKYHFGMMFEPGDIQILNNHVTYHARTEFEDYPDDDQRRHLLRMWLSLPNTRDLSPSMSVIYQNQRGGTERGGFPSRTGTFSFETVPAQD